MPVPRSHASWLIASMLFACACVSSACMAGNANQSVLLKGRVSDEAKGAADSASVSCDPTPVRASFTQKVLPQRPPVPKAVVVLPHRPASYRPSATTVAAEVAMLNRFKHPNAGNLPVVRLNANATGVIATSSTRVNKPVSSAAATDKLPHWGDKDCLCHDGLRLYKQGRYLEAASFYHRAGETMYKAWGVASIDVAHARRGEAACYAAAGRWNEACALEKQAIVSYIRGAKGKPAPELEATLLDLCDAYRSIGRVGASNNLRTKTAHICALAELNPARAITEFSRL